MSVADVAGIETPHGWKPLSVCGRQELEAEVVRLQKELTTLRGTLERCRAAAGLHAQDCQTADEHLIEAAGEANAATRDSTYGDGPR